MKRVLIVEDSAMVMRVIKHVVKQSEYIKPLYAETLAQAQSLLEAEAEPPFAALVDLNLPDAPGGEIVDYTLAQGIPTVVLTGTFDEQKHQELLAKGVVDYVTKEGKYSYQYAVGILHRLIKNAKVPVLVVDDSTTSRNQITHLLKLHHFPVLEASDGAHAIKLLLENPTIRLVITDYNMPRMDGCEMIRNLRCKYEKSDLVIIGLSSDADASLSAKFIKTGANDFLRKPFHQEEFSCRVQHNVEQLELIESIKDSAWRDMHTGVYNRQYFFRSGAESVSLALQKGTPVSAAIIDLDKFSDVNETIGNEAGDIVLRRVAQLLANSFERFLFARAEGNRFYTLMVGLDLDRAIAFVDRVREVVASTVFEQDQQAMHLTMSAGVVCFGEPELDTLMQGAFFCLQRAKDAGGNLVIGDDTF